MIEVHNQVKPARPWLLTVLTALSLIGALGLAWMQAREARHLGAPRAVGTTPLRVRVPQRWLELPESPGTFALPGKPVAAAPNTVRIERQIQFRYQRLGVFTAPEALLAELQLREPATPARIGPYSGFQVRLDRSTPLFGRQQALESLLRVVITPRGEQLAVEYGPVESLSAADFDLMEEMCESATLDGAAAAPADDLLRAAGVQFPLARDWRVHPPDFAEVPGVFIESISDNAPVWVVSVHRTWLGPGRTPQALLADVARIRWDRPAAPVELDLPSGHRLAAIQRPDGNVSGLSAAFLVTSTEGEAALLQVYANAGRSAAADQAAREIAGALRFVATERSPDFAAAAVAGRDLVEQIAERGVAQWWGAASHAAEYRGSFVGEPVTFVVARESRGGRAFRGSYVARIGANEAAEANEWSVDAAGRDYSLRLTEVRAVRGRPVESVTEERRRGAATLLLRTLPRVSEPVRVALDPLFVPPPVEMLVEAYVAAQQTGAWLIQASPMRGDGVYFRWLRPLPPDERGAKRVLSIEDFQPRGVILAFDERGELLYQRDVHGWLDRDPGRRGGP